MDVRKKLFTLFQDCNNPSWKWFPNNAEMMKLIDYLIAHGVTVQDRISVDDRLPEEKLNCIVHYKHVYCDNDDYWEIGICFMTARNSRWICHTKSPTGCRFHGHRKDNDYG